MDLKSKRFNFVSAGGQFVIVSSAAGKAGVPFSGSYTGSKHAINVSIRKLCVVD